MTASPRSIRVDVMAVATGLNRQINPEMEL